MYIFIVVPGNDIRVKINLLPNQVNEFGMCTCICMFFLPFCFVKHSPSIVVSMHQIYNCSWNEPDNDDGRSSCYHTVKSLITFNFSVQE